MSWRHCNDALEGRPMMWVIRVSVRGLFQIILFNFIFAIPLICFKYLNISFFLFFKGSCVHG